MRPDSRGFLEALIGDGRPLISLTGLCLGFAGLFALFQSSTGYFLPHDSAFLQMDAHDLCSINECRIVHFMFHDRVSFGGALIAIAVVYLWLAEFPLKAGEPWAWYALLASGVVGFGSFLTYLGYGYLDNWHAIATVGLLPCFIGGLWLSHRGLKTSTETSGSVSRWRSMLANGSPWAWQSRAGIGRLCLLTSALGMMGAGFTIQTIGMTHVFVDTDLAFMGLTPERLDSINPRLIPLIAHDRAGFGGGVATGGLLLFACVWYAAPSRSLWQGMLIGGTAGWTTAIGIHPIIGYTNFIHVAPAVIGAILYFLGLALTGPAMLGVSNDHKQIPAGAA